MPVNAPPAAVVGGTDMRGPVEAPRHDAGQGPFHPRDDHDHLRPAQEIPLVEDPVHARHPDVVEAGPVAAPPPPPGARPPPPPGVPGPGRRPPGRGAAPPRRGAPPAKRWPPRWGGAPCRRRVLWGLGVAGVLPPAGRGFPRRGRRAARSHTATAPPPATTIKPDSSPPIQSPEWTF